MTLAQGFCLIASVSYVSVTLEKHTEIQYVFTDRKEVGAPGKNRQKVRWRGVNKNCINTTVMLPHTSIGTTAPWYIYVLIICIIEVDWLA